MSIIYHSIVLQKGVPHSICIEHHMFYLRQVYEIILFSYHPPTARVQNIRL